MLNISGIQEGFVLDHIQAGMSFQIYHDLKLDRLVCCVGIIKNARSNKMGKKDIIKVECPIDALDLDILGFIDHNITVNIIKNEKIVEKRELSLPKEIKNVIRCKNPRCITSIEQELDQIFVLTAVLIVRCIFFASRTYPGKYAAHCQICLYFSCLQISALCKKKFMNQLSHSAFIMIFYANIICCFFYRRICIARRGANARGL